MRKRSKTRQSSNATPNASYKYTLTNADLKASKSPNAPVITVIPAGTKVQVIDAYEDWYEVSYNNQMGYLSTSDLSITKYTWRDSLLRTYPAAESNPNAFIPAKSEVQVLLVTGDWSQVIYNDHIGYLFNDFLTDDGNPPDAYDFQYFYTDMIRFVNDNQIKSPTTNLLTTDLENKYTYVFEKAPDGKWMLLYKWLCTVGKPLTPTIKGTFYVQGRKPYFGSDSYRVKYATRILGAYYYHSILFNAAGTEITDARLGEALSHGCIRLDVVNAQWIYDNILDLSTIVIN